MSFFIHDRPVVGARYFFGRELLVRSLREALESGRTLALCGGPKTGHTSTLLQTADLVRERWAREPKATKLVPIYVDLASLRDARPPTIATRLWETLTRGILDGAVIGKATPPRLPEPKLATAKDCWAALSEALAALADAMSGSAAWCRWALLLDGADLLFARGQSTTLAYVSSLAGGAVPGGPAATLLTGGRHLREAVLERKHPLAGTRVLVLGVLKESEARTLVRAGLPEIDDATLETLLEHSGRHPYALQRIAAELESQRGVLDLDAATQAAWPDLERLCESVWAALDFGRGVTYRGAYASPEHALLQLLIDNGGTSDVKSAERALGIKPLKEFAELLEYLGVAERFLKNDTAYYRLQFALWNGWYSERVAR